MTDHRTIWKFIIPITDEVTVQMPLNARVLPHAAPGPDGVSLMIWAEVDPDKQVNDRHFRVVGTGNPLPDIPCHYVTTAVAPPFVWHLYDAGDPQAPLNTGGASSMNGAR